MSHCSPFWGLWCILVNSLKVSAKPYQFFGGGEWQRDVEQGLYLLILCLFTCFYLSLSPCHSIESAPREKGVKRIISTPKGANSAPMLYKHHALRLRKVKWNRDISFIRRIFICTHIYGKSRRTRRKVKGVEERKPMKEAREKAGRAACRTQEESVNMYIS